MASGLLIGFIIFLGLLVVVTIITTLWMRNSLHTCETTQSAYCYQLVCPTTSPQHPLCGQAAFRCEKETVNADGTCPDGSQPMCSS